MTGPPRRTVSPSSTTRSPPGTCTVTRVTDQPATVCDRGDRARAGAAAQRLPHPALPDPHGDLVGARRTARTRRWCGCGKRSSILEVRAVLRDPCGGGIVDEQHQVRVPHPGGVAFVAVPW